MTTAVRHPLNTVCRCVMQTSWVWVAIQLSNNGLREPWRACSHHALNVVSDSISKGLRSCTHVKCDKHCADKIVKEQTYTLELHVPVLGGSIILSSHLATLKTTTPHSVTADCTGLKK